MRTFTKKDIKNHIISVLQDILDNGVLGDTKSRCSGVCFILEDLGYSYLREYTLMGRLVQEACRRLGWKSSLYVVPTREDDFPDGHFPNMNYNSIESQAYDTLPRWDCETLHSFLRFELLEEVISILEDMDL